MNKATIFMSASWIGLAGVVCAAISLLLSLPEGVAVAAMIVGVLSCIVMLWARNADEFTQSLWTAGASVAFGTMLITYLGLPFAEGFADGLSGGEAKQSIPASVAPALAILAFYIGLFVKRLLGDV